MRNLTLKGERLGQTTPKNPTLVVIGSGLETYLWIGNENGFLGIARNTPETRRFLRRALERMEKGLTK